MSFLSYFDLNKRSVLTKTFQAAGFSKLTNADKLNTVDIGSTDVKKKTRTQEDEYSMSLWEQIAVYSGIVAGVLFSSAAMQMKSDAPININISASSILVSLIIAFVILPAAYEKLNVNPASPLLVRIGLAIQHGVFWQVLFGSIGKMLC
jgi:multidrug transporter EmrE-like cation transporter